MKFIYNDGGRREAGFKGNTRDCGVRAIAIAAEMPYQQAYDIVNGYGQEERNSKKSNSKSSARTGVYKNTFKKIMRDMGFTWTPTMGIGTGCTTHLVASELPGGTIICNVSKHYVAVINGVIQDTFDCSREGTRCVYGYWK